MFPLGLDAKCLFNAISWRASRLRHVIDAIERRDDLVRCECDVFAKAQDSIIWMALRNRRTCFSKLFTSSVVTKEL
jgi:hypothetical protein